MTKISIVMPAKNEAESIPNLLSAIMSRFPEAEVILVDDGSSDNTARLAEAAGANVVRHPYSIGNGGAIKSGARAAKGNVIVFMDADGQHQPEAIGKLVETLDNGYDMVVGARSRHSQASRGRWAANTFYNWLASLVVGHPVDDLTSGFRAVRADKFKQFLHFLPNGFSYPTTITMAFFRSGYLVTYVPVDVKQRVGKSHIRPFHDGVRFLLIIFKIGTLYSPLKLFFPTSVAFIVTGLGYYLYTFSIFGRFTNMSALLMLAGIMTFLVGLVSEQITTLLYSARERTDPE